MKFDQIINTSTLLREKQIQPAQQQKYGNILFVGGGSGSGKNWVLHNLTDVRNRYKIFDIDDIVEVLHTIQNPSIVAKFNDYINSQLRNDIPLRNELLDVLDKEGILGFIKTTNNVYSEVLYGYVNHHDLFTSKIVNMVFSQDRRRLNNIAFVGTLGSLRRPYEFFGLLQHIGYNVSKAIDILWVVVPEGQVAANVSKRNTGVRGMDIQKALANRNKSVQIMFDIVEGRTFLTPFVRDCYVVINTPKNIKYYKDTDVVEDFKYFKFKLGDSDTIEQVRDYLNDD